jgi:hypothetical protein
VQGAVLLPSVGGAADVSSHPHPAVVSLARALGASRGQGQEGTITSSGDYARFVMVITMMMMMMVVVVVMMMMKMMMAMMIIMEMTTTMTRLTDGQGSS